ncbi:ATP-binding protein [Aetokthonos hydrillicola Thurmond2011]|uniref:Circadian input-output histidine kinase CikA n=4 Tax=Aetokthonos TaxID=1550243 RepID=A0AAP5I5Z6_9CYAN|nr:response regulator [Aetokthonos hydrillicola CCALA 1050]MDR9895642.1 ATP-binding protein [Aetokthonos hydrillicola Thurmond2011]
MCRLMRSHDWGATSVGPVETWSQSLKTAIRIILGSRYPMFVWWGNGLTNFYNDAYIPVLGKRHPQALGQPACVVWAEIWDILGAQAEAVLTKGQASWNEELLLVMERNGYTEETYFTFSYSPVMEDSGEIKGVFCACTEDTRRVLSDRRIRTLRELAAATTEAKTAETACELSARSLSQNSHDLPFALIYLLDETRNQARLVGTTGLAPGTFASPEIVEIGNPSSDVWKFSSVTSGKSLLINPIPKKLGSLPGGPWPESPTRAVVLPLSACGQDSESGFLVAGVTPRREFDDDYQGFFDLVAGQISNAIADARAYEAERKRAEALAELDRAKTVFFSNVSHEFRTPLTLMLGPTEDALTDEQNLLPPIQRDRIEIVQRNGLRLLKLVNTLLDFSRIQAGRIQANYEATDLAKFTAELASTFRSLIERAGMNLVVDCPPLPEAIYVDCEMWEKIILNLLSNAFKFTFTGTITVTLRYCKQYVELCIADTGIGIPADEIPHLFERFHRVKGAQGRSFEGSGIGLSLVYELVKLHGGSVNVISALGEGSCFTISLPVGCEHLPPERVGGSRALASIAMSSISYIEEASRWLPKEAEEQGSKGAEEQEFSSVHASRPKSGKPLRVDQSPTPVNPHFGKLITQDSPSTTLAPLPLRPSALPPDSARILVVDDNADMRDYLYRLLSQRYEVEAVEDGMAAIATIRQGIPDLVLTDVMMPKLDGFSLLRELRSDPQTQNLPIILLSARAGEESRIEGLEAGADDYLIKPFSARELLARVEANLKMAQMRQEAAIREQALRLAAQTAQQEAERAYERLRQTLESMTNAFVALDNNWRIIYMNPTAEQINKKLRSEVIGKTLWEEWPASVGTNIEYQYRRAMTEQIPVHFEHHYYVPPDYDVWLEVHAYPSKDGLGIFYQDITDVKRYEAERRRNEEEREQLLQREQAAREQAETANRIKDEFLAVLSHELRSPLNPILGWSKLLQTGRLDAAKTAEALSTIERNAKLQSQLIEDLLDVSRILRGKLSLTLAPVQLKTVITEALSTVSLAAKAKSIEIKTHIDSKIGSIQGDSARLQQIVWNLLSNAVKFTPTGGKVIVRLESVGSEAQIQVIDTGKGISPDFLPHVFECFRQEDSATTRKFGGLGLGLAIVKQLVELHGGTIHADSLGEGQGATFTVKLPLMEDNVSKISDQGSPSFLTEASLRLNNLQILIVDDEPDSREFLAFVLEQAGMKTTQAASAIEALTFFEQYKPDLLISDIGMPEMDGYSLLQTIRTRSPEQGGRIRAIALTAYASETDQKRALAAGFDQHIAKPVDPDALLSAIANLIS